jgi:hypothetical protein
MRSSSFTSLFSEIDPNGILDAVSFDASTTLPGTQSTATLLVRDLGNRRGIVDVS